MKTSTVLIIILILLLLLLLVFSPIGDFWNTVKSVDDFDKSIQSINLRETDRVPQNLRNIRDLSENQPRIVVSLTTLPERIADLKYTVMSLLKQTVRPDEIAINLPYKTLKGKEYTIPSRLLEIPRVKIYRLEKDLGPASKLLPTLKRETNSDTKIIVVDDDVVYPPILVEKLVQISNVNPDKAITTFPKKLTYKGLNQPPISNRFYSSWVKPMRLGKLAKSDYVMGVYGFLVKPRFFDEDLFNYEDKPPETIWVDDMHISGQLSLRNIEIVSPAFNPNLIPIPILKQQRAGGLFNTRNREGENDNKVITYYWGRGAFHKRK